MSEMDEWVKWYEANGLVYFPIYGITNGVCRCENGASCGANTGKHPIYRWKGQPSRKPRPTDNVGISTDNLVVIDLDGDVSEEALDQYPRTFTTGTGHGYHLWYRADPTKTVKSVVGWKPKVDIRAHGGLVIAPPSRHRSGSVYRHVRGDTIQPVPRTLLDSLPEKGQREQRRVGHTVTVLPGETHPLYAPLAAKLIEDLENWQGGRNQTLFRVACRYFEWAAAGVLGSDVLLEISQTAINLGLTPDEVARTIDSASKSV